jgi:hypothetical protein
MGRVKVSWGPQEDEIRKMHKDEGIKTFDLSYFLFKEQFSKSNLESYIKSLEQLSYPKESEEDGKRLRLHSLFSKMLGFVEETESSDFKPAP